MEIDLTDWLTNETQKLPMWPETKMPHFLSSNDVALLFLA